MEQTSREELEKAFGWILDEQLSQAVLSAPAKNAEDGSISHCRLRPVLLQNELKFQAEEQRGKQAFHKNLSRDEAVAYLTELLDGKLKQAELTSAKGSVLVLVSKKGKVTVKVKRAAVRIAAPSAAADPLLSHNRKKRYVLEEGKPVPFLVDLGVMTEEGKVVKARYDKFRQINRFLEFIEDILPKLSKDRELTILDFGCGKSYLTFAMYYYLKELNGYSIRVIGLDLKEDVIALCNRLSRKFGFDKLTFYHGDIAEYEGVNAVDMVVTLHACDTATDYALAKAVGWGASVILSVPCCQHELNRQMKNETASPVLGYGLLKERMAALMTDGIRAQVLEHYGYRTQILEFIDMEHTPKNILIRAVKQGKKKQNGKEIHQLLTEWNLAPTICELLPVGETAQEIRQQ